MDHSLGGSSDSRGVLNNLRRKIIFRDSTKGIV